MGKKQLQKWKDQQKVLSQRIQAAEAREKITERKKELQRKILVGSFYLNEARKNNQFDQLQAIMNEYLKRNNDRNLFNLPALEENK